MQVQAPFPFDGTSFLHFIAAPLCSSWQNATRHLRVVATSTSQATLPCVFSSVILSSQRSSTILFEFSVIKNNEAKSDMQRERTIAITEDFMAEVSGSQVVALHRYGLQTLSGSQYPLLQVLLTLGATGLMLKALDAMTYDAKPQERGRNWNPLLCVCSLSDILGLVVSDSNELEVVVEFRDWHPTHYYVSDREAFVGSLADTVQNVAKNSQFSIRLEPSFQYTLPEKPLPLFQVSPEC